MSMPGNCAVVFREIGFGSEAYREECRLRDEVLRAPLGLSLRPEDLESERDEFHFGIFEETGGLLACAVVRPVVAGEVQIRQVAVAPTAQGGGLGRKIMESLEAKMRRRGVSLLRLHARTPVAGFYEKLGYAKIGEEFLEISLPHVEMEKRVPSA
jgi:predicted GNAT family N-acyltransferase